MASQHLTPPPWWVKFPLYAATGPGCECSDLRVSLHNRYLRAQQNERNKARRAGNDLEVAQKRGLKLANELATFEAKTYAKSACLRGIWWTARLLRMFGMLG